MKIFIAIIGSIFVLGVADAQMTQTTNAASNGSGRYRAAASPRSDDEATEARKVEAHINELHNELKITTAEEPQWSSVAKTMRENAEDIDRVIDKREAAIRTATAVENLNSYADVVQAHAAAVKRLADTFSALYSEMSDSQKKMADEIFSHRRHASSAARS